MNPTTLELTAASEAGTQQIGRRLAAALLPGDVVALDGELGAGKTRLVRGVVDALDGRDAPVSSPTFVIIQRYDARFPIDHVDAYRLSDGEEFLAIGGEEIFAGDGICLIEWARRLADVLPPDHLQIRIEATSPQSRRFVFQANGPRSEAVVAAIRSDVHE